MNYKHTKGELRVPKKFFRRATRAGGSAREGRWERMVFQGGLAPTGVATNPQGSAKGGTTGTTRCKPCMEFASKGRNRTYRTHWAKVKTLIP